MSDERKRSVWPIVVGVALTLVLYILSSGPALRYLGRRGFHTFLTAYAPLVWAFDHNDTCREALNGYIDWWQNVGKPPRPPKFGPIEEIGGP